MNNTERRANRTDSKLSASASTFEKVLQALADGDLRLGDLQSDLRRLFKAGASPEELLEVLRRRKSIEPLPEDLHAEILRLVDEEAEWAAVHNPIPEPAQQDADSAAPVAVPAAPLAAVEEDAELVRSLSEKVHAAEERIAGQNADYEELTRAYERARDAGSAAAARAIAIEADLTAARSAVESERNRAREMGKALAERNTSAEAERSRSDAAEWQAQAYQTELRAIRESLAAQRQEHAAQRVEFEARAKANLQLEADQHQAELRAVRDSLDARDATIGQLRSLVGEHDVQLAAQQREHSARIAEFEAQAKIDMQLEADLHAERTRTAALTVDLKSARTALESAQHALESEERRTREVQQALADKTASADAARARSQEVLLESERYQAEMRSVRAESERRQAELRSLRDSLKTRDQTIAEARRSLDERGAAVAALEARAKGVEAELKAARTRVPPNAPAEVGRHAPSTERGPLRNDVPKSTTPKPIPISVRRDTPTAPSQAEPSRPWTLGPMARAIGVAAILVFAVAAWFFFRRAPEPAPALAEIPASSPVAVPVPGSVIRDCPTCPGLTVLPAGRFKQVAARAERDRAVPESPAHWVTIDRPFALSTNTVTVAEFSVFVAATGRDMQGCDIYDGEWRHRPGNNWETPGFSQSEAHPVTCVSWSDAKAYSDWLSTTTGHRYRLPSASEWEYAARAGSEAVYPWSPDGSDACVHANVADQSAARRYPGWAVFGCDDGNVYTAPVGSFKANSFGLNDMLGNVFQWTLDCWNVDPRGAPIDGSARTDGDCTERELRGGSWFSAPAFARANSRNHFRADYRTSSVGIRLVRDIAP